MNSLSSFIDLEDVEFKIENEKILKNISFKIKKKEFVTFIGASGSGKSMILKLVASIVPPSNFAKFKVPDLVGYAPQNNLLIDYYTVQDNILIFEKIKKKAIDFTKFNELATKFGLEKHLNKYPPELSGGLQSRVTLLRAYYMANDIMLLDEPFSALDEIKKIELRKWLKEIYKSLGITILYVTHDIDEAIEMSDKIIIIKEGEIVKEIEREKFTDRTYQDILDLILD